MGDKLTRVGLVMVNCMCQRMPWDAQIKHDLRVCL